MDPPFPLKKGGTTLVRIGEPPCRPLFGQLPPTLVHPPADPCSDSYHRRWCASADPPADQCGAQGGWWW